MQTSSSIFPPFISHQPYSSPYSTLPTGPQDHDLKRQYLALLPPQQIVDICLTFDVHAPPYIKATIWPIDLNAAITAMRKVVPPAPDATPDKPPSETPTPAMDSLPGDNPTPAVADPIKETPASEPPPPDKQPTTAPTPTPPATIPTTPQPPYPHQPYGYPHPSGAYPHTPYYPPPPPGYPSYPHAPYPPYPPLGNGYPPPTASGFPPPPPAPFTNSPLTHPPQPQENFNSVVSADDLPSYEEMIVEALTDSGDPEGCAPKDLFTWMASHYPLQSNFRPSASQALQKAYKRGRFEKSGGGKYRLNATWEGGNTSRRTTRRPQTQNQSTTPSNGPPTVPPFTHAPLVHHHQNQTTPAPASFPPRFGYPYPPPPGYLGLPSQPPPAPASASGDHLPAPEGNAADAYEAAQNILKAINFGGLLQMSKDEESNGAKSTNTQATADATSSLSAPIATGAGIDLSTTTLNANAIPAGQVDSSAGSGRAELQAQLALLAAQLAEIYQADDAPQVPPAAVPPLPTAEPTAELSPNVGASESDDDDDMEEVI